MNSSNYIEDAKAWSLIHNWRVFPASPKTKAPCITEPFEQASNDPKIISELFSQYPGAMIGVPCGPLNRITVLDIDRKNGVDGLEELRKLQIEIPLTGMVKTPSGGFHIYFESGQQRIPNSVSKLAPGIDVRGHRGYVIGPNSQSDLGRYRWGDSRVSIFARFAPLPSQLQEKIAEVCPRKHKFTTSISKISQRFSSDIQMGERNSEMASRIGYLLKKKAPDESWKIIQHLNETRCKPPLTYRELERTFLSILKRELRP